MMTGVNMVHVPYRGSVAALTDMLGGPVQVLLPPSLYELAGLQAPQEGEAGHRGHPLSTQPVGAIPLFYVVWPLVVVGLGLFLQRRRLT
jgi:hypothetical protein